MTFLLCFSVIPSLGPLQQLAKHQDGKPVISWNFFPNVFVKRFPSSFISQISYLLDQENNFIRIFGWWNQKDFAPIVLIMLCELTILLNVNSQKC